jgi:hypothetical protein
MIPLATRRNHNPRNKTHHPEINKPQGFSMCYPIDSNICIKVDRRWTDYCLGLMPDNLKTTWFWDLTEKVCMEGSWDRRWMEYQPGCSFS